jgi:hypothetical protein
MQVDFNPSVHGFQFSNNDIKWSFGPISAKALCGGMIYAALDYYNGGMSIPDRKSVPVEGESLHTKIYDRQWDAHYSTVPTFLNKWMNGGDVQPEVAKLKRWLGAACAVPVCLYSGMGHGHHTLGIGLYETSPRKLVLYDPNFPNKKSNFTEEAGGWRHSVSNELWKGFFVDDGYKFVTPDLMAGEGGWVRCIDCRLLYATGGNAPCPKGSNHNPQGSAKYVLNKNAGSGDKGWKKCFKCSSLFNGTAALNGGVCADGGIHAPVAGKEYTLGVGGVGQDNWRRCIYCNALFWLSGGGIGGVCPGGDRHKSDLSKTFTLPFK